MHGSVCLLVCLLNQQFCLIKSFYTVSFKAIFKTILFEQKLSKILTTTLDQHDKVAKIPILKDIPKEVVILSH